MIKLIQKIVVIAMFAIPAIGFMVTPNDYVIKDENRVVHHFPNMGDDYFFSQFVKWFNDRLLFKIYSTQNFYSTYDKYFSESLFSCKKFIVKGKDGWMFLGDDHYNVYSRHSSDNEYFEPKLFEGKNFHLQSIKQQFNGKLYFVVGPDKHGIYSEYMSPFINSPGKYRYFDKVKQTIKDSGITLIDNYDVLMSSKDVSGKTTLYYVEDNHWNKAGAYVAFKNVMNQILDDFKPFNYKFTYSKNFKGSLIHNYFDSEKKINDVASVDKYYSTLITIENLSDFSKKEVLFDENLINFENKFINMNAPSSKKVFLITDSFGCAFAPYVVDYFKTVIYVHRHYNTIEYIADLVRKEQPDIVIYINVERSVLN